MSEEAVAVDSLTSTEIPEVSTATFDWVADFLGPGLGIFLGVIAGALIQYGLSLLLTRRNERVYVRSVVFEMTANQNKLNELLEKIQKMRNAINSDTFMTFFEYFDTSGLIAAASVRAFESGLLYKYLDPQDIIKLQTVSTYFTIEGERVMNESIANLRKNFDKANATMLVNIYEERFKDAKQVLQDITAKLPKK